MIQSDKTPSSPELQKDEAILHPSMHAVNGTISASNTFTLSVLMGGLKAIALVDSGSSTTFVSPQFAEKA